MGVFVFFNQRMTFSDCQKSGVVKWEGGLTRAVDKPKEEGCAHNRCDWTIDMVGGIHTDSVPIGTYLAG